MRKLELKDANKMMETLNDKSVTSTMRISLRSFSLDECKSYILNSNKDNKNIDFAITDESDNWVGTISLKNIDYSKKEAEYAIITSKDVHGKGYSQKATKEILEYAFNELKLDKVYLYVSVNNIRANKFYQKVGFIFDRCEKSGLKLGNEYQDINWYYALRK